MVEQSRAASVNVVHNSGQQQFEARVDGQLAVCVYRLDGRRALFVHTEVPVELEGRGIAAALVRSALAWAVAEGLQVVPRCSYVASYLRRHPLGGHGMGGA